jgi:hypothetical protein
MQMRPALEGALRVHELATAATSTHASRRRVSDGLTGREHEVARLLAAEATATSHTGW